MTMLKFWINPNSFRCVPLDCVSFSVVKKEDKLIISLVVLIPCGDRCLEGHYNSAIYIQEEARNEELKKLTEFFDEAFKKDGLLIEIPDIFFGVSR